MKEDYEGQGLELLFRILGVLAGTGLAALTGLLVWGVWKWLS